MGKTMSTKSPSIAPEAALLANPLVSEQQVQPGASGWKAYLELSKPRILILILLTAIAAFCLATSQWRSLLLLHMSLGIGLLAAGTAALNQYLERDVDADMRRTERRPLPSGRLTPAHARLFGALTSIAGLLYLLLFVNPLTALLGVFTLVSYVFVYTPLKRKTSLSTLLGAFPGAMPALMGWTSATGAISIEASVLFTIMFLWQFPHFLAIAWIYREDYARAGICMLPVIEQEGKATGRQIVLYAIALVPVSLLPTVFGIAGGAYFIGALLLGFAYLYFSVRAAFVRSRQQAKRLLQASVLYLPLLFVLMLLDKITVIR
jgi:heme o synthase